MLAGKGTRSHGYKRPSQPARGEIPLTPYRRRRRGQLSAIDEPPTLHGGIWAFAPIVRRGTGRDDLDMASTDHIDQPHSEGLAGPLLICFDGSDHAKYAIRHAAGLLAAKDALVVTVWQPTAFLGGFAWAEEASMVDLGELDRAVAEEGRRVADEGVRIAREAGLAAEPMAVEANGPVWKTVTEIADRYDATTIVMGSRGLRGLRSMLLGSISSAVVHHADRPVLVVHIPGNSDAD